MVMGEWVTVSRLIYISRARQPVPEDLVETILETARTKNAGRNVTGLLLFDGMNFMQLLEGPSEEVEALFDTIVADDRHGDIVRIVSETGVNRQFPGWSMGYAFSSGDNLPEGKGWFPLTNGSLQAALPSKVDPAVRVLFTSFLGVARAA